MSTSSSAAAAGPCLWIETEPDRYHWSGEPDHRGFQLDCDVFLLDGRIVQSAGLRGTWVVGGFGRPIRGVVRRSSIP